MLWDVVFWRLYSMVHEKDPGRSAFFDDLSCWIPCDLLVMVMCFVPFVGGVCSNPRLHGFLTSMR